MKTLLSVVFLSLIPVLHAAETVTVRVAADKSGARINPAMWGVFFEDINFGADGGLYAELVKNRSFEFPEPLMGWSVTGGSVEVRDEQPFNPANPHYLRLAGDAGVVNEGFRGMGIRAGEEYRLSAQARAINGAPMLRAELVGSGGQVLASAKLTGFSNRWKNHTARLKASATDAKARLRIVVEGGGTIDLDMVSLFPKHTWKQRPNGLRADLVQMLADLKPGFVRFPGGCIVEGRTLDNRYQWKNTIGDIAERKLIMNRWNVEFADRGRGAADYFQSFGLGFFEYFQLCEDLGAQPLPILNCGMACQFNSAELCPLDRLQPYIQDALDLIEFANGPVTSTWGAKRAALGHPKPFGLKMLGIGNEQWGPQYVERYENFAAAVRARHPGIQLVAASGPDPGGDRFDFLWKHWRELKPDFVDEHFYRPPDWFFKNVNRYDRYDRTGPKVFAGEYAAHPRSRDNNLEAALAEAAMMTGFERNADVVRMASYAPLFAHVEAWQWGPDLIWFDNLRAIATPNYHVQRLFSLNRGDVVLPVLLSGAVPERLFASATRAERSGEVILKLVNATGQPVDCAVQIEGVRSVTGRGKLTVLTSERLTDVNTFDNPNKVSPQTSDVEVTGPTFSHRFPAQSVSVLRVHAQ